MTTSVGGRLTFFLVASLVEPCLSRNKSSTAICNETKGDLLMQMNAKKDRAGITTFSEELAQAETKWAGIDFDNDGKMDVVASGLDASGNGIPDALEGVNDKLAPGPGYVFVGFGTCSAGNHNQAFAKCEDRAAITDNGKDCQHTKESCEKECTEDKDCLGYVLTGDKCFELQYGSDKAPSSKTNWPSCKTWREWSTGPKITSTWGNRIHGMTTRCHAKKANGPPNQWVPVPAPVPPPCGSPSSSPTKLDYQSHTPPNCKGVKAKLLYSDDKTYVHNLKNTPNSGCHTDTPNTIKNEKGEDVDITKTFMPKADMKSYTVEIMVKTDCSHDSTGQGFVGTAVAFGQESAGGRQMGLGVACHTTEGNYPYTWWWGNTIRPPHTRDPHLKVTDWKKYNVDDNKFHHLMETYDGITRRVFWDKKLIITQNVLELYKNLDEYHRRNYGGQYNLTVPGGRLCYGNWKTGNKYRRMVGETKEFKAWDSPCAYE